MSDPGRFFSYLKLQIPTAPPLIRLNVLISPPPLCSFKKFFQVPYIEGGRRGFILILTAAAVGNSLSLLALCTLSDLLLHTIHIQVFCICVMMPVNL